MWDVIEEIETALKTVIEFKTVNIGVESGLSAKECPAIRIVPISKEVNDKLRFSDDANINIVLLIDLKNNLREASRISIADEILIRGVLSKIKGITFNQTTYDQDSVKAFKATVLNYSLRFIEKDLKGKECKYL